MLLTIKYKLSHRNIHYISEENNVLNHFLSQLREVTIQKIQLAFQKNLERIFALIEYKISKKLM